MTRTSLLRRLLLAAALVVLPATAQAQYTFVGSWSVADGPRWGENPQAMSGRQTAAFLFGGSASDYAISTQGSDASMIDFRAFMDGWGDSQYLANPAGHDFVTTTRADGGYDCGSSGCSYSAFVRDHSSPGQYVNYAFRIEQVTATPEPGTVLLLGSGLLGVAGAARVRRRRA